jgi:hypothetical protein
VQLIAIYTPEQIDPKRTNIFVEGSSMLHMNVSLVHGNKPECTLMGASDKDFQQVLMINQELR